MKLSELIDNRRFQYKCPTDMRFYYKHQDKDCVVAYCKHHSRLYVIIKGEKLYALCFDFSFIHIYDLKTLLRNVKDCGKELTIINDKEFGNIKKQMILEALNGKN